MGYTWFQLLEFPIQGKRVTKMSSSEHTLMESILDFGFACKHSSAGRIIIKYRRYACAFMNLDTDSVGPRNLRLDHRCYVRIEFHFV